jgi:hypothetical protein
MTQREVVFRALVAGGTIALAIASGCSTSQDQNPTEPDAGAPSLSEDLPDDEAGGTHVGPPACSDGIDNDSDGRIDYPTDPNCTSPTDNSEQPQTSPPPATGAASVDTTRMPVPPQSSKIINVTSPIKISGTVTDVTYNVTGSMPSSAAITLGTSGRLERVRVNVNGRAMNGVVGGTLKDVYVTGATYAGIASTRSFDGVVFSTNNYVDFYLSGSGVKLPANAMIKSANVRKFSFMAKALSDSRFDGPIVSVATSGIAKQATSFECWSGCRRNLFNIIISDRAPGYGMAIYGADSADNVVNEFLATGVAGTGDSDPGISIGGGAARNVIHKATVRRYTVGVIFGEDVDPSPHDNVVHTLIASDVRYGCVYMDRGAYNNIVGDIGGTTCTNAGGADSTHHSSVWIANRPGQTNVPPHDNQVLGLKQSGTGSDPRYSVYLGPGTTRNRVTGTATKWTVSKVADQGSANTVNVQ